MAYPTNLDSFSVKVDGQDDILAAHMNSVQAAIVAVETELGLGLRGSVADLATRLAVALNNDGTLKTAQIVPGAGSITHSMLATGAVQSDSILDGTITGADIAASTITGSNLAAGTVGTGQLAGQAVTTAILADSGVTSPKIAGNAVGTSKLSATWGAIRQVIQVGTIPVGAGTIDIMGFVPISGTVAAIKFTSLNNLAANDTNYLTIGGIEKGAAGSGVTAMTTGTAVSTTKLTGGQAIAAFVPMSLGNAGVAVVAGDIIDWQFTVTGTLANPLTQCILTLTIVPNE